MDFGTPYLLLRRDHFGGARNDDFAILVHALGVEDHLALFGILLSGRHLNGDRVANLHGPPEAQVLAEVDRARSRKIRAEHG